MKEDVLKELKKYEDTAAACNRCGFCTSYCPTYIATGDETYSPRGRNQMFRALIEGKVTDVGQAKQSIDTCLLCGECTSICFSEVPTADLMVHARHFLNKKLGVPWMLRLMLRSVLPYPKNLRLLLKLAFFGKRVGVSWFLRKIGLLQRFAPSLAAADELVTETPLQFLMDNPTAQRRLDKTWTQETYRQTLAQQKKGFASAPARARPKVGYIPVCGSQYLKPSIGLATMALLDRLKVETLIAEAVCCGLPASSYGVKSSVRYLAEKNIEMLERGRFETIITDDSSCASHFKDYPRIFQGDPKWMKRSHDLSQKMRELSYFFVQNGMKELLRKINWVGGPVAYHDPCKSQYSLKMTNPPRELLGSIPNLKLTTIADSDQCCGGGGTYSFVHPDISQNVLAAKVRNVVFSGCSILVTSSASCQFQLSSGLRALNPPIEVLHLTEFLERAFTQGK